MEQPSICLCIVFNHAFPSNIPFLEKMYRHRFSQIKYLMPFTRDPSNPDVIPVYRGSYQHQGFATDAWPFLKDIDCTHLVFLQDDVMLHPSVNETNILSKLRVASNGGFINQLESINLDIGSWHWMPGILWKLFYPRNLASGSGVDSIDEIFRHLPPVAEAMQRMEKYGIGLPTITRTENSLESSTSVVLDIPYFGTRRSDLIRGFNMILVESLFDTANSASTIEIPYPFAKTAWGADFFIVPKYALPNYVHYSGVLAAANIFAEIAVGTALLLSVDEIATADGSDLKFEWDWSTDRDNAGEKLITYFSDNSVFAVHPVKLSALARIDGALDRIVSASLAG